MAVTVARLAAALPSRRLDAVPAVTGETASRAPNAIQVPLFRAVASVLYANARRSAPLRSPRRHCSVTKLTSSAVSVVPVVFCSCAPMVLVRLPEPSAPKARSVDPLLP